MNHFTDITITLADARAVDGGTAHLKPCEAEAEEAPFQDWMLWSAYGVLEDAPVDPDPAIAELTAAKEAVQAGCRDKGPALTCKLPSGDDEALAVLVLARAIVQKINVPFFGKPITP